MQEKLLSWFLSAVEAGLAGAIWAVVVCIILSLTVMVFAPPFVWMWRGYFSALSDVFPPTPPRETER